MEDAVTRTHAQQLIAASLYVGSRVAGKLLRRLLTHPNRVELRADGLAHTPQNANRLQALAARVSRQAIGEPPAAVVAAPDPRGGWRIHLAFAEQRPPLQPFELTDLQATWERAKLRVFGPAPARATTQELLAREQDADRAFDAMRRAQARLFEAPSPETRAAFTAALNRAQVATDGLRATLRRLDPVRFDKPLHHDALDLLVALRGDERLTLVERDGAVRDLFARAAALGDPADLRVMLRPTRDPEIWRAHVAFNFRNTEARGPQHLNPASLQERILDQGPSQPAISVPAALAGQGTTPVQVSLALVQAVREAPQRGGLAPSVPLDPPAAMRVVDGPSRGHA
jgi:hypothetical protein